MKEQLYTSTPPMGRTACTEPQCLYKGDLYHFTYCVPLAVGIKPGEKFRYYSPTTTNIQDCSPCIR